VTGGQALEHFLADGLLPHLGQKILDYRQADIRFDQGDANLAQGFVDIGFFQLAAAL